MIFAGVLRSKAYLCCFTQFTLDQPKLTVNGSVLSDTPNVRYLVAQYIWPPPPKKKMVRAYTYVWTYQSNPWDTFIG